MNRGSASSGSRSFASSHSFTAITSVRFCPYNSAIRPHSMLRRIWRSSWSKSVVSAMPARHLLSHSILGNVWYARHAPQTICP